MDCLDDFIGLNHCSILTTPESGLYLNDLPGVEIQNIDQIANAEQATFMGVWEEIQKRALKRFRTDVINEFGKRYRIKQVQQTLNIGKEVDTATVTAAAVQYRGFTVELNQATETYVNSNMQSIFIQTLYLYLPASVNTTIKVFDLDLGTQLYTYSLTGSVGWNTVNVGQYFEASRIFVCYDATTVNSVKLDITNMYLDNNSYINNWLYTFWHCCSGLTKLKGASSAIATLTTTTAGQSTFGLSGILSIRCTYNSVVCYNKEHFGQALLYCLGSELMTERINSSRINRWTTVDKPKAVELRKYFEARYKGGVYDDISYDGELTTAVFGIDLNKRDACLQCNSDFQFVEARL